MLRGCELTQNQKSSSCLHSSFCEGINLKIFLENNSIQNVDKESERLKKIPLASVTGANPQSSETEAIP